MKLQLYSVRSTVANKKGRRRLLAAWLGGKLPDRLSMLDSKIRPVSSLIQYPSKPLRKVEV